MNTHTHTMTPSTYTWESLVGSVEAYPTCGRPREASQVKSPYSSHLPPTDLEGPSEGWSGTQQSSPPGQPDRVWRGGEAGSLCTGPGDRKSRRRGERAGLPLLLNIVWSQTAAILTHKAKIYADCGHHRPLPPTSASSHGLCGDAEGKACWDFPFALLLALFLLEPGNQILCFFYQQQNMCPVNPCARFCIFLSLNPCHPASFRP